MLPSAGIIVSGGGIVGLAAAYNLLGLYSDQEVMILEKEGELAWHQTGHNSNFSDGPRVRALRLAS